MNKMLILVLLVLILLKYYKLNINESFYSVCLPNYSPLDSKGKYSNFSKSSCGLDTDFFDNNIEQKYKLECPGVVMKPDNSILTYSKSWCRNKDN